MAMWITGSPGLADWTGDYPLSALTASLPLLSARADARPLYADRDTFRSGDSVAAPNQVSLVPRSLSDLLSHSFAYNTLQDLQNALNEADQLARTHHFHHVYIDTDQYTHAALAYLSGQMQTPHTVLSGSHCLLLPDPAQGPALMLLGPADTFDTALLTHFASTMLVSEPPRLGGAPFHLYIVQPLTTTPEAASFVNALTLDRGRPASFSWHDPAQQTASTEHFLATSWTNLAQLPAAYGTTYTYHLRATYAGNGTDGQTGAADCAFTSITPGEQLLAAFPLPSGAAALPASLSITGSTWMAQPYEKSFGPFHFLSGETQTSLLATLRPSNGTDQIVVQNE